MLTPAQQTALKNDATSPGNSAALGAFLAADDYPSIAAFYNTLSTPDFWVYRTSLTRAEMTQGTSQDGTTFTYVGNGFITRSAGEQAAWNDMLAGGSVNPSLPATRQAFADIFSGTGNAALNRTHLTALARRKATRIEKLLATGTGSPAAPATMGFEGQVIYEEVQQALLHG
jgi:hypothetical protein